MWRIRTLFLTVTVCIGGCVGLLPTTQSGAYRVMTGLTQLQSEFLESTPTGLEGSRVCLLLDGDSDAGEPLDSCFEFDLRHPTEQDEDGCYILETENWLFGEFVETGACDSLAGDTFLMPVVPASDVVATLWPSYDVFANEVLVDEEGGPLPRDLLAEPGEPIRVVDSGEVGVVVLLNSGNVSVGYDAKTFATDVEVVRGAVEATSDEFVQMGIEHTVLTMGPDAEADVGLALLDGEVLRAGSVVSVAASEVTSLSLVAGYDPTTGDVVAVRAVTRGADGALIHGVPVEFTSSSEAFVRGNGFDYASVEDCVLPPSDAPAERRASVTATYGELSDTIEVRWLAEPLDSPSLPLECAPPSEGTDSTDTGGCGCRGGAPVDPGVFFVGVLCVLWRRGASSRARGSEGAQTETVALRTKPL